MTDIADTGRVWVVRDIATLLRVSDMTIRRRINSGDIPSYKVGRAHRVRESALLAYLEQIGYLPV
jgi:excisionase family DNA binding protein